MLFSYSFTSQKKQNKLLISNNRKKVVAHSSFERIQPPKILKKMDKQFFIFSLLKPLLLCQLQPTPQ